MSYSKAGDEESGKRCSPLMRGNSFVYHVQFHFIMHIQVLALLSFYKSLVFFCLCRCASLGIKENGGKMVKKCAFLSTSVNTSGECLLMAGGQVHIRGHWGMEWVFAWVNGRGFLIFIVISGYCSTYCVCTLNKKCI